MEQISANKLVLNAKPRICYLSSPKLFTVFSDHIRNVFFNSNFDYIFPSGYNVDHNLNKYITKKNTIFYSSSKNLLDILNKYDIVVTAETFDLGWFVNKKDLTEKEVKEFDNLIERLHIVFLTHGITCVYNNNGIIVKANGKKRNIFGAWIAAINGSPNKRTKIITSCDVIYKTIYNYVVKTVPNNIIKVKSIPQFKNNMFHYNITKENHELNSKINNSIVILPTLYDESSLTQIENILDILHKYFNKSNIILRVKAKAMSHPALSKWFEKSNCIKKKYENKFNEISLQSEGSIGKFFGCKMAICLNGGTCFFEFLNLNNKTFWVSFVDNSHYQRVPLKFKKLFISENYKKFEEQIVLSNNENYFDFEYTSEKKQIFQYQTGNDSLVLDYENEYNDLFDNIINEVDLSDKWDNEFKILQDKQWVI